MRRICRRALPVLAVLFLTAMPAAAYDAGTDGPQWSDTFTSRLQALALLQTLNADLLSNASATLTLDRWCGAHDMATPPTIVADRVRGQDKVATPEVRALLKVGADEAVNYRRVRLRCGTLVLSEADNWYVPSRLTAEMNQQLETTDIAFGRAVKPLNFTRVTLSATLLWRPLPQGWEMAATPLPPDGSTALAVPPFVLEHRAVLNLPDGTAFSALVESYTRNVLAFHARASR